MMACTALGVFTAPAPSLQPLVFSLPHLAHYDACLSEHVQAMASVHADRLA